ncbi:MAG: ABC transporter ATP-binding protein [Deltaproteobacteria bacterium]|jgi:multiple sugar transport system ATP-binding protein
MASLTVKGISKRFGKTRALTHVDLDVEDGAFCVLLGPSGCGKSTLLNIIAGLIPQDRGSVLLDGHSVDHLAPRDRDVAMVFQSYALYPHMTVAQNLGFGLRMRGVSKAVIEERTLEAAGLLGITELLDRRPRELSGGQRQRVAMGRALVRRPRLFLLDEPLSNLDARLRANVRIELKRIHRQIKGTIVYVTHDQVEALTLGDKVVVMREGQIRQMGSPEEIYARPADKFVAVFIGSPEMNVYGGRVVSREGRPCFQGSGFFFDLTGREFPPVGDEVELGLRPEDIRISPDSDLRPQAKVEMVSNLGSEMLVHARLGEETVTICADKDTSLKPGELISLTIDPRKIHLFHKGRRL